MPELYYQRIAMLLEPRRTDQEKPQLKRCLKKEFYRSQRLSAQSTVFSEKVKPLDTDLCQPASLIPTAVLSTPVSCALIDKALDPPLINANRNLALEPPPQLSSQQREQIDAIATISQSTDVPISTPPRQPPSDSRSSSRLSSRSSSRSNSRFDSFHLSIDLAHNPPENSSVEPAYYFSLTAIPVDSVNPSAPEICAKHPAYPSAPTTLPVDQVHLSVSKYFRTNSDTSTKRRNKCKQKLEEFWTSSCSYFMSRHNKLEREAKQDSSPDDDDWVKTVSIIFEDRNGNEILRHAKAKFDTGNPKNLISPAFAAKFGLIFEPRNGEVILELPGEGQFISNGRIAGRWCSRINTSHDTHLGFDPKFMDADFEVSNSPERFDIVIGADTIKSERLLEWRPALALTGFRNRHEAFPKTGHQDSLTKLGIARDEKPKSAHSHSTSGRIKGQQNEMHREDRVSPLLTGGGLDATQQQEGNVKKWRTLREEKSAEAAGNTVYSPYTDATKSTEQEPPPFTHPGVLNEHVNYSDTMENHPRVIPEDEALPVSEDLTLESETKITIGPSADESETSDDVSDDTSSEGSLTPLADSLSNSEAVEDLLSDVPPQPSPDMDYDSDAESDCWSSSSSAEIENPDHSSALYLLLQGLIKDGFPEWLHTENYRDCAISPGAKQQSRDQSAIDPASSSHGGPSRQPASRKRGFDSHDHNEGDEGDDESPKSQRQKLQRPEGKRLRVRLFACPFSKHQPLQYMGCILTGHDGLNRVKQHMKLRHSMPLYCPICFTEFKCEEERDSHVRTSRTNPVECVEKPPQFSDRITKQQAKHIHQRMNSTEENWYRVYEILFPGHPRPKSPWYNDHHAEEALMGLRRKATGPAGLTLARNILLLKLHPELRRESEHILGIIMNIFNAFFTEIIENWKGHIEGPTNDSFFEPSASDNNGLNGLNGQTSNAQPLMPSSTPMAVDPVRLPATSLIITGPSHFISSATTNTAQDTSMSSIGADLAQLSMPTASAPSDPTMSLLGRGEPSQNFVSNADGIHLDPRLSSTHLCTSEFDDLSQTEEYINGYPNDFSMTHGDDLGTLFPYMQREYR